PAFGAVLCSAGWLIKGSAFERTLLWAITGGLKMRMLIPTAILAVLVLVSPATPDDPKANDLEDALFPLPPREVAAGMLEKWQREAAKRPSSRTYTRVEYDRKAHWVVEASFGYGDPSEKIAVYAPTKDGSFRRCLLAGPIKAGKLAIALDPTAGILSLTE